jgi:hypothetical protein
MLVSTRAGEAKVVPENKKVGIFCGLDKGIDWEARIIKVFERLAQDLNSNVSGYDATLYYQEETSRGWWLRVLFLS